MKKENQIPLSGRVWVIDKKQFIVRDFLSLKGVEITPALIEEGKKLLSDEKVDKIFNNILKRRYRERQKKIVDDYTKEILSSKKVDLSILMQHKDMFGKNAAKIERYTNYLLSFKYLKKKPKMAKYYTSKLKDILKEYPKRLQDDFWNAISHYDLNIDKTKKKVVKKVYKSAKRELPFYDYKSFVNGVQKQYQENLKTINRRFLKTGSFANRTFFDKEKMAYTFSFKPQDIKGNLKQAFDFANPFSSKSLLTYLFDLGVQGLIKEGFYQPVQDKIETLVQNTKAKAYQSNNKFYYGLAKATEGIKHSIDVIIDSGVELVAIQADPRAIILGGVLSKASKAVLFKKFIKSSKAGLEGFGKGTKVYAIDLKSAGIPVEKFLASKGGQRLLSLVKASGKDVKTYVRIMEETGKAYLPESSILKGYKVRTAGIRGLINKTLGTEKFIQGNFISKQPMKLWDLKITFPKEAGLDYSGFLKTVSPLKGLGNKGVKMLAKPAFRIGQKVWIANPRTGMILKKNVEIEKIYNKGGKLGIFFKDYTGGVREEWVFTSKEYERKFISKPTEAPRKTTIEKSVTVNSMNTNDILIDPERFQYKTSDIGAGGVSPLLKNVTTYDPQKAGVIAVWKTGDKTYVVNGHHRLELAKRTGVKTINVLNIQAETEKEARSIGAMLNIAEGRGTDIDASKFFRDTGITKEDLMQEGISLKENVVNDGLALANLDEKLFMEVIKGTFSKDKAIIIGRELPKIEDQQSILKSIEKEKDLTAAKLQALIDLVKSAGHRIEAEQTLFGETLKVINNAIEKAEIISYIRTKLSYEKNLFKPLSKVKRVTEIEKAENVINIERNKEISDEAEKMIFIFDKSITDASPTAKMLNFYADKLAEGGKSGTIKKEAYEKIKEALRKTITERKAQGITGNLPAGTHPGRLDLSALDEFVNISGKVGESVYDFMVAFGKAKRELPELYTALMESFGLRNARVDLAVNTINKITKGEKILGVINSEMSKIYEDKTRANELTGKDKEIYDNLAEINDWIEKKSIETGIFQRPFYERMILENKEKIEKLKAIHPNSKKIKELETENVRLSNIRYLPHNIIVKKTIEAKIKKLGRPERIAFLENLSRISAKFKKRSSKLLLQDYIDSGLITDDDIHFTALTAENLASFFYRASINNIYITADEMGLVMPESQDLLETGWQKTSELGIIAPEMKNKVLHPLLAASLQEMKSMKQQSTSKIIRTAQRVLGIVKIAQFFKPVIIWHYDILEKYFRGIYSLNPVTEAKCWIKSIKSVLSHDQLNNQLLKGNVFGVPREVSAIQEKNQLRILNRRFLSNVPAVVKKLEKITGETWDKVTVLKLLQAPIRAIANITWLGDRICRTQGYLILRRMKYPHKEAMKVARKAYGDYSVLSKKYKDAASLIFFVYSFRLLLPIEMAKTFVEPIAETIRAIKTKEKIPKHKRERWSKAIIATILIPFLYDLYMKSQGWKKTEKHLGPIAWKWKKTLTVNGKKREIIHAVNNIINMPIKYWSRASYYNPTEKTQRGIQVARNLMHWEIHPLYRTIGDILKNRQSFGGGLQVYDPNEKDIMQIGRIGVYLFSQTFKFWGAVLGEQTLTHKQKTEQDKYLKKGITKLDKILMSGGYQYIRLDKKTRKRLQLAMLDYEKSRRKANVRKKYDGEQKRKKLRKIIEWKKRMKKFIEEKYKE